MQRQITLSDFRDQFRAHGREEQFTYDGLTVLFEYLEDALPEYELDVIELCCEYAELTFSEFAADYLDLNANEPDSDELREHVRDFLDSAGTRIGETSDTVIYQQF